MSQQCGEMKFDVTLDPSVRGYRLQATKDGYEGHLIVSQVEVDQHGDGVIEEAKRQLRESFSRLEARLWLIHRHRGDLLTGAMGT